MKNSEAEYTKEENHHRITIRTVLQSFYLTISFFFQNDLISYASTCAFGFLFSFIPVVMMILVILIRVLHANLDSVSMIMGSNSTIETFVKAINGILHSNSSITQYFDVQSTVTSLNSIKTVTNFEIVIGLAIILMARRFFVSVMNAMRRIFNKEAVYRPVISQLLSLAEEALLVIIISVIVFAVGTFRTVVKLPILEDLILRYPLIFKHLKRGVNIIPFVALFLAVSVCYRLGSATKPRIAAVFVSAASCTFAFIIFQKLMGIFININKYNIIYGVLSGVIVILMEVLGFFMIFLFFAQFLFVYQFFTTLILGELYLLPSREDTSIFATLKRLLFIKPDILLNAEENVVTFKRGDYLYRSGELSKNSYYLAQGSVLLIRPSSISYVDKGNFFGEEAFLLDGRRHEDAKAASTIKAIAIPEPLFKKLIERNPQVSKKALSQINYYFAKFYGRNNSNPL